MLELQDRGVQEVEFIVTDGLAGLKEVILGNFRRVYRAMDPDEAYQCFEVAGSAMGPHLPAMNSRLAGGVTGFTDIYGAAISHSSLRL